MKRYPKILEAHIGIKQLTLNCGYTLWLSIQWGDHLFQKTGVNFHSLKNADLLTWWILTQTLWCARPTSPGDGDLLVSRAPSGLKTFN